MAQRTALRTARTVVAVVRKEVPVPFHAEVLIRTLPKLSCPVVLCVSVSLWWTFVSPGQEAEGATGPGGGDWPTYRHDIARSGVTTEGLPLPLSECWVFQPRHAPRPAWSDPNPNTVGGWYGLVEYRRVHFDDAFHLAVAGGTVFFGSSATGKVYALDAATGGIRWSVFTGGPVRLAPTVWKDKVYVGSDDGFAYCLRASDGHVVWKFRAAPEGRKVLGSGKMISLWPLRTSILVDDQDGKGVAYMGAGLFPAEGVLLCALGAEDGRLIWRNDTCGDQPQSRISPQGYLLASKTALFAPTGRVSPASFDRKSGRLLYQAYVDHRIGGSYALISGDHLFTGTKELMAYNRKSPGARLAWFQGRRLIVKGDQEKGTYYLVTERDMSAIDRKVYPSASLQRRNLLGQKRGLGNDLRNAKRDWRRREAPVKATSRKLSEVEKKLAPLVGNDTKPGQPESKEAATLKQQRDALKKTLSGQQAALDAATRRVEEVDGKLKTLGEELGKVNDTVKSTVRWRVPCDCHDSMIMAGDVIFAGGKDKVVAIDAKTGNTVWTGRVEGKARGLAAARAGGEAHMGRLFVSTDTGAIYCFGPAGSRRTGLVRQRTTSLYPPTKPNIALTPVFEAAAEEIVRVFEGKGRVAKRKGSRGYCLVLGLGSRKEGGGRLALELAKRTGLMIYGVDPDPRKVEAARKALDAAGLYGVRVCFEAAALPSGLSAVPYSDYFADLIVSESALVSGDSAPVFQPGVAREAFRMLKPPRSGEGGGVALIGQPTEASGVTGLTRLGRERLRDFVSAKKAGAGEWRLLGLAGGTNGLWATVERGRLKGAGKWTHQYAEPGNTACGDDQVVKCPLGVLWYGEPGPGRMEERHRQAVAPLSSGGRFFVQGENVVMAYDAYNGVKLWERDIPGAKRTGMSRECSNLALNRDSLFVAVNDKCLCLDVATGETRTTYSLPPSRDASTRRWGYVATVSDGRDRLLFGSGTKHGRNCDSIFTVDLSTGKHRWVHQGNNISHITIAIGEVGGERRIFFADTGVTPEGRREALREKLAELERLKRRKGEGLADAQRRLNAADVRLVVALDARTGRPRWQRTVEVTDCRRISKGGGELICMYSDGVLVFCAASANGHFWKEFFGGEFARRTVVALSARDGRLMWAKAIGYRHRPLIVGDTLIAEPWAFDLRSGRLKLRKSPLTGEESPWQFARPGHHCGAASACPSTLFFRSYAMAYYDLLGDYGTQHFGSVRPGCWINMIPANGVVIVPEAASGCMCPFPTQCTVVFQPKKENRSWAMYSAFKPGGEHKSWAVRNMTKMARSVSDPPAPVHHLALNLGAPGDRKDDDGTLWLGYPRPRGSLVFQYGMRAHVLTGGYYRQDPLVTRIAGTDKPWVYASGCRGLARAVLPLVREKQKPGLYTVRLGFVEPDNDRAGERVFDIKLQGSCVLEDFDVFGAAGGAGRVVVREFDDIQVDRDLTIELVPKGKDLSTRHVPVVNSIEVKRTKSLNVSLTPPSFLLSDFRPEQTREFRITSHSDRRFLGTLRVGSVRGFTVEVEGRPRSVAVRLEPGERKAFTLKVAVRKGIEAGEYHIPLKVLGPGLRVESENAALVNHLGTRREVVLRVAQDTFARKKNLKRNFGSDHNLWVDGGDKEMGDRDHSFVYFKFRLDVPGRPKSARVRLHVGTWGAAESGNSGVIRLVKGEWDEKTLTYENRPELGEELAKIGRVGKGDVVEREVAVPLEGRKEVSIALAPTSCDGAGYCSRETGKPAELIVEFEAE